MKTFKLSSLLFIAAILVLGSCKKETPPPNDYPVLNMTVTHTIRELQKLGPASGTQVINNLTSTDSIVIKGVVTSTDKEGNIYQYVTLQDQTGAIKISMEKKGIFNEFSLGQQVYVVCNGLDMGRYGDYLQLGSTYIDEGSVTPKIGRIPANSIAKHIFRTDRPNPANLPALKVITDITQLHDSLCSMLVTLKGVEFVKPGYAWSPTLDPTATSPNNTVRECKFSNQIGKEIIGTYTSSYATFGSLPVPKGKGDLTGILTIYKSSNTTWQMILRTAEDYKNGGFQNTPLYDPHQILGRAQMISLETLRAKFEGKGRNDTVFFDNDEVKVEGIVISDGSTGNSNIVSNRALFIQDAVGGFGINVFFSGAHNYALGDKIEILIDESRLFEYYGVLELENTPVEFSKRIQAGVAPAVRTVTIDQIKSSVGTYESTLVKIENVLITHPAGGDVFLGGGSDGNHVITDINGNTMVMRISGKLPYASNIIGSKIPTNRVNMTGIIGGLDSSPQITFRNLKDLEPVK